MVLIESVLEEGAVCMAPKGKSTQLAEMMLGPATCSVGNPRCA